MNMILIFLGDLLDWFVAKTEAVDMYDGDYAVDSFNKALYKIIVEPENIFNAKYHPAWETEGIVYGFQLKKIYCLSGNIFTINSTCYSNGIEFNAINKAKAIKKWKKYNIYIFISKF